MEPHVIFCSALDREVRVLRDDPGTGRTCDGSAVVCLGNGDFCTGSLCPVCASRPPRDGVGSRAAAAEGPP